MAHTSPRLAPSGRRLLVDRIELLGWPVAHVAEAGLDDRSSRPHNCPTRLSSEPNSVWSLIE